MPAHRTALRWLSGWTTWSLVHWKQGLVVGFSTLLLLNAFVSENSIKANKQTEQDLKHIVDVQFQKLVLTQKMREAAHQRTTSVTQLIFQKDPFDREESMERFDQAASDFLAARRALLTMNIDKQERALLAEQARNTREAQPFQRQLVDYASKGEMGKAQEILVKNAIPTQEITLGTLNRLAEYTSEQTRLAMERATAASEQARGVIFLLSVVAGFLGLVVALVVAYLTIRAGFEKEILATHDTLTGLPNRLLIHDHLAQAMLQAHRDRKLVGVVFIDLDRFKVVNDSLGHDVGDELLRTVSVRLRSSVRETDIVARLGGDEFIVMVQHATQVSDVLVVVDKVLEALQQPYQVAGREVFSTCSIGVSLYPHDGDQPADLIKHADVAMYKAKKEGRNQYRLFDASMAEFAAKRLETETELHHAVENDELELHYQPQLDVATGKIVALEALIRWRHPTRGILSPAHFLTLLEETGLIQVTGGRLLLQACLDCVAWQRAGHTELSVSFNLSAMEFWHEGLVDRISHALDESGIIPDCLNLELTEGILMEDVDMAIQRMEEIKALGVGLSVDDFGTGYSCLAHLMRFPVEEAKIDRFFVTNLEDNKQATNYLSAILALSNSLSLQTVIEGVETLPQLRTIQSMGDHIVQGYLISKPVPADEIVELLNRDWREVVAGE